ncbi:MAG: hypothetical protein AB7K52_14730 [Phycisphaerales bacterium]
MPLQCSDRPSVLGLARCPRAARSALLLAAACLAPTAALRADIPPYQLIGQFAVPPGIAGVAAPWDILPDGRVVFLSGTSLLAADVRLPDPAATLGSVPASAVSSFGPSFLAVSPSGTMLAFGDNNFGPAASVHFVSVAALSTSGPSATTAIASPNYQAAWADDSTLLVTGFGAGPVLTRIDSSAAPGEQARTLMSNIADGSGGVTLDAAGRVYVGAGFDAAGGATTGHVRAFDLATLQAAPAPADFLSGTLVARALSADSLGFDTAGNLLIGGGDFFSGSGDFGSAAVIRSGSIAAALAGAPIDPLAAQLRLSPAGPGAQYAIRFNFATDELLISDGATLFRYAVPAPGPIAALALAAAAATRRRRHA